MSKKQKVYPLLKESYLAAIENSIGTKMFRNFYAKIGGKKQDVTKDGELSCAYFVSLVLLMFGLIKKDHLTVGGLLEEMKKCSWKKIEKPRKGSVLIWEAKDSEGEKHRHIGFFLGHGKEFTTHWKEGRKDHSFEKEMKRLGIKHLYTRPYRPQTNGKVEAFWKIIKREFLTKYFFKDWREFNLKLHQYMYYYNQERRHGGLNYLTPAQKLLKLELESSLELEEKSQKGRTNELSTSTKGRAPLDSKHLTG